MIIPNFKNPPYNGEMLPYERSKLYNWILEYDPKIVFEVGTGNGGGSTYYIAHALKSLNKNGLIYTCDPTKKINSNILNDYDNIKYYQQESNVMLKALIEDNLLPDFIMFDGPEDPNVAINDILYLEKYLKNNTYFSMHDWDLNRPYDKGQSTKSIKIREHMEKSSNWVLIEQLFSGKKNSNFDDFPFDSVGLCLYKFKKNNT